MKKEIKIYELSTSGSDGYNKYLVYGIKSDSEAKALAKKVFGKYYYGISYYDDTSKSKKYKTSYGTESMSKSEFLKYKKYYTEKAKIEKERMSLNYPDGVGM